MLHTYSAFETMRVSKLASRSSVSDPVCKPQFGADSSLWRGQMYTSFVRAILRLEGGLSFRRFRARIFHSGGSTLIVSITFGGEGNSSASRAYSNIFSVSSRGRIVPAVWRTLLRTSDQAFFWMQSRSGRAFLWKQGGPRSEAHGPRSLCCGCSTHL